MSFLSGMTKNKKKSLDSISTLCHKNYFEFTFNRKTHDAQYVLHSFVLYSFLTISFIRLQDLRHRVGQRYNIISPINRSTLDDIIDLRFWRLLCCWIKEKTKKFTAVMNLISPTHFRTVDKNNMYGIRDGSIFLSVKLQFSYVNLDHFYERSNAGIFAILAHRDRVRGCHYVYPRTFKNRFWL